MTFSINRYSLDKKFISVGTLKITDEGQGTNLLFTDAGIQVKASDLCHPLIALASLRETLEREYASLIACNGCRCDTSYRPTGGFGTYKNVFGRPATERMNIFEPTSETEKLCTVAQHKAAYKKWIESLGNN